MRVLAVIDSLEQGGAERSLVETLRVMDDVEVHVALLRRSTEGFEDEAVAAGFRLHTVAGSLPRRVTRLRRLLRDLRPDVVHASLWQSDLGARLACIGRPFPLVTSLVNDTYGRERTSGYPLHRRVHVQVLRAIDRATARRVDRFHAVSRSVADHHVLALGLSPERIEVAWRGRDTTRLVPASAEEREAARAELGLDGTVLLAIGRLEPQKLHTVLVEAIPWVVQARPDARLVIVGREGSASDDVRRRADELDVSDRVWCTGFRSDVATFLAAADRFVLPSSHEGIAGAVIEAMLAGVPALSSDLPGVREISGDGALVRLVPIGDARALADAIIEDLADAPEARERARRARDHAAQELSLETAAAGLLRCYGRAAADRRSTWSGGP